MTNHINDRVIIVTGAGGGFGQLICEKTAALGARVVAADINESAVTMMVDGIKENGGFNFVESCKYCIVYCKLILYL